MPLDSSPNPEALLQHADFLRGLARGLVAGADADDVEQETWLRSLEKGPRHDANPRGWLSTVARNSARLWWRGESRRARREGLVAKSEGVPSAAEVASRVEIQSLLADAVKSLEEPYRTTVVLAFYDGLKPKQIAQQQGISVDTVRTRIRRALERLRARLDSCLTPLLWPKSAAAAAVTGALVMSTRLKIALIVLILIPTLWLGREALRGHVDGAPVRTFVEGHAEVDGEPKPGPGEAPKVNRSAPPAAATGFVGRVVAEGQPVQGAWVSVGGVGSESLVVASTPADGTFRTPVVHAWHPSYGPTKITVDHADPAQVIDIELPRGHSVQFVVTDARTGSEIAGAKILVLTAGQGGAVHGKNAAMGSLDLATMKRVFGAVTFEDMLLLGQRTETISNILLQVTDDAGRVSIEGLPEGRLEAVVLHPDYAVQRVRKVATGDEPVSVKLGEGGTVVVRAPMIQGRSGRGLVCEVLRGGMMPMPVAFARLDEDGVARLEHLPTGSFAVVVSSGGSGSAAISVAMPAEPPPEAESEAESEAEGEEAPADPIKPVTRVVVLRDGETHVVDLADPTGTRLFGRVLHDGIGLAGRKIWLDRDGRTYVQAESDKEGRFAFDQLPAGRYELGGESDDVILPRIPVEVRARQTELELDLVSARGVLVGTVVDLKGELVEGAHVVLTPAVDAPMPLLEEGGEIALRTMMGGRSSTNEAGAFRIAGVPAGEYEVCLGAGNRLVRKRIRMRDGEERRIVFDLRLEPTKKLVVSFADAGGKSIPATLLLRGAHGNFAVTSALSVSLDPRRSYEYRLPQGRYRLTATAVGLAPIHGEIVDLDSDRKITLPFERGSAVELTVRRSGRPVEGARVTLVQDNGIHLGPANNLIALIQAPRHWLSPAHGVVVIHDVRQGSYRIRIDGRLYGRVTVGTSLVKRSIDLGGAR